MSGLYKKRKLDPVIFDLFYSGTILLIEIDEDLMGNPPLK